MILNDRRRLLAGAMLAALLAAPVHAQLRSTGTGGGPTDPYWSYQFTGPGGATGSGPAAWIISSPPIPPWAPNSSLAAWIGAAATGNLPGGNASGVITSRYFFTQVFNPGIFTSWNIGLGWDLSFFGAFLGGTAAAGYLDGTRVLASDVRQGFCRDAVGVAPGGAWPNCTVPVTISGLVPNQDNTLTFVVDGDGVTDGLYLDAAALGITPVPEPATVILLGTGLAAVAGLSFARRRRLRGASLQA